MTSTLFFNGTIRTNGRPGRTDWVVVDDDKVASIGASDDGTPAADRRIDLAGGALVPAFCDAHVHLPATGLYASGMDFRGVADADTILRAYADRAKEASGLLFGGNFEDPLDRPLTRVDLDGVVGDRAALLARADMHSCIVSSSLLSQLPLTDQQGIDRDPDGQPTGYLREQAASAAWRW
ncbi:MAG: hypothetical protein QOF16_864, partial [Actinomycetota bacterium]|nr:hypothetical protein [Actinomycetota bacterium]